MIINFVSALSMGAMFAFVFWILNDLSEPVLFQAIVFVLGGFAESLRRWMLTAGNDDG